MFSLSLSDLMEQNFKIVHSRPSQGEITELLNTHHLLLIQEDQPTEVLTRDQIVFVNPGNTSPAQMPWTLPILAKLDTDALSFYKEHLRDLRPVIVLDSTNEVKGIISFTILVSNLLKHCEILDSFFLTLLDTVGEAVTVVTREGTVSHWNSVAQDTYSISQQNIVGKHIAHFFEQEALATLKILDEGRPVRQSYHSPRPGTHVLMNASPVLYDGTIIGAISSEQDITQIVRLNEKLSSTSSQLRELEQKTIAPPDDPFARIIGKGQSIRRTISIARKIASSEATILITGESGVGKELFAQAIHLASPRGNKSFIALNCGAIPPALFESELFGYNGGAFTGAERKGKPGKLELAHEGTLFLDEIGELPVDLQVKLLRVLQDRSFYRLGGAKPITTNTRIIAATNRDLEKMINTSQFREDLYYRLNVITLEVPPLRERTEDIPELVQTFLLEFALKHNKPIPSLDPEVIVAFLNYKWPGNVRELHNVAERMFVLADEGTLEIKYLPPALQCNVSIPYPELSLSPQIFDRIIRRKNSAELGQISAAIEKSHGNKSAAAKLLGISRGTLYYKLKQYGLV